MECLIDEEQTPFIKHAETVNLESLEHSKQKLVEHLACIHVTDLSIANDGIPCVNAIVNTIQYIWCFDCGGRGVVPSHTVIRKYSSLALMQRT